MSNSIALGTEAFGRMRVDGTTCDYPTHLKTPCPYCGHWASFAALNYKLNPEARVGSASGICPSCDKSTQFVFVFSFEKPKPQLLEVRMFPALQQSVDMPELPESVPEPLRRSYEDTVRAFNARIYGSAATSGRRTLEGIFKYMVPEASRNVGLYKLIKEVEEYVDFAEPLKRLADAIRSGGNLGAHFDETKEPDAEMAKSIIELLGYLIDYLYVLPSNIKALEDQISEDSGINF